MQFTINKNEIRNVLAKIQGLTGRRTNLAISETVLIKTAEGGITMTATDLETGFEGSYTASVESEGVIAVNAKKLYEIVREFPSDEIIINEDQENHCIKIGNQNIEYRLITMNPEDFPDTPHIADIDLFDIDSAGLKRMIEKTVIISGASDDKRAHINGILFERIVKDDEKLVRMVSTDGSRLSKVDVLYDNDTQLTEEAGIIIPKKGLHEVSKFLDNEGTAQIGFKDNHFVLKKDTETVIIRLLDGDFPKYADIIAKKDGNSVKVERRLFLMMLKRMSILSSENYKGVIFDFGGNKLKVSATNPDIGESKEEMDIEFEGESLQAAFNPKYFIDTLNMIDDDIVALNLVDDRRPCIIEGENDKSYLTVVMPMRI